MKKQSSGLYRTKVVIGHDEKNKPISKWISAKTKKELEAKRIEVIDKYINGNKLLDNITFGTYAKEWYEVKKKPFLSKGTQNMYSSILNNRLLPKFRNRQLSTITSTDIQSYINSLSELSEARVQSILIVLKSILDNAKSDGYIRVNPAAKIRINAQKSEEKRSLTKEERTTIENISETHVDGVMLALLYYTGMRNGEARALLWSDIDLENDQISIHGSIKENDGVYIGSTKTESSVRTVPIPEKLHSILQHEYESKGCKQEDYLIHLRSNPGKPITAHELRIRWSRIMQACNMGEKAELTRHIHWDASITPHALRHNYTTMLYENGIDPYTAAKLLGHSSINTTMDIYTHFSKQAKENTKEKLDNIWKVAQKLQQNTELGNI